jgi:hypothetical protein
MDIRRFAERMTPNALVQILVALDEVPPDELDGDEVELMAACAGELITNVGIETAYEMLTAAGVTIEGNPVVTMEFLA